MSKQPKIAETGDEVPSKFANRAYIRTGAAYCRIVFGENVSGKVVNWHNAFTLPTADLEDIARLIMKMLDEQRGGSGATHEVTVRQQ